MPDKIYLRQMQALPMIAKVRMSQQRIREWYDYFDGNVFISFSGGKDSTVLTHIVHEWYPNVPLVFCNTGLEYPEIQDFARRMGAEFIRPKMQFSEVISTYGYPIISKENAEAIHYARKIRNSEGGGTTTVHHRREINGQRLCVNGNPCTDKENFAGGGYTELRKRDIQTESRHYSNQEQMGPVCTREESVGDGQRLPANLSAKSRGGYSIPQPIRMRMQLNNRYGGITVGGV